MKLALILFFKGLVTVLPVVALMAIITWSAAAEEPIGTALAAELEAEMATTAPVTLAGNPLFRVRGVSAYPAEQRAQNIQGRIVALARNSDFHGENLSLVESEVSTRIMAGDQLVMNLYDADARGEGVIRPVLAAFALDRIRQAIADYRQARSFETLRSPQIIGFGNFAAVWTDAAFWQASWFSLRFGLLTAAHSTTGIHASADVRTQEEGS